MAEGEAAKGQTMFRARIFNDGRSELSPHRAVQVFAGPHEGALGLCGSLTMRTQEAEDFIFLLGVYGPANAALGGEG